MGRSRPRTARYAPGCPDGCRRAGATPAATPYSSKMIRPSSFVPEIRFAHCSGSMSPDCVASPVCMSVYCSGRWIRNFAPTALSSFASWPNSVIALSSASFPLCSPANTSRHRPSDHAGPVRHEAAVDPAAGTPADPVRSTRSRRSARHRGTASTPPGDRPGGTRHPRSQALCPRVSRDRSVAAVVTGAPGVWARWARYLFGGPKGVVHQNASPGFVEPDRTVDGPSVNPAGLPAVLHGPGQLA